MFKLLGEGLNGIKETDRRKVKANNVIASVFTPNVMNSKALKMLETLGKKSLKGRDQERLPKAPGASKKKLLPQHRNRSNFPSLIHVNHSALTKRNEVRHIKRKSLKICYGHANEVVTRIHLVNRKWLRFNTSILVEHF